jgi:menaquinone-dependent protoporphyrinogen oxidase
LKSIIIYATKYGFTEKVALRIQKELGEECQISNILKDGATDLVDYDTVILGGSIYIGRVQKQLTEYISGHKNELLNKKIGLYLCAGSPKEDDRITELRTAFSKELLDCAAAADVLGYAFDFDKMGFFDKLIMKKIKGDANSIEEFYDVKIKAFTEKLLSTNRASEN